MARTNANDAAKAPAPAANTTVTTPAEQASTETSGPAIDSSTQEPGAVAGSNIAAVAGTGPVLPVDPANGLGSTVQAGQPAADAASTDADAAAVGTATISPDAKAFVSSTDDRLEMAVAAEESTEITIYPLRSYLDGKEIRRAGGKPYKSPKHDAVSLIAAGLATDKQPKS